MTANWKAEVIEATLTRKMFASRIEAIAFANRLEATLNSFDEVAAQNAANLIERLVG